MRVAYQYWFKNERVEFFNASGACTGLATAKFEAEVPAEFEGINGFKATQTITFALPACTALNLPLDMTRHLDANYAPIGESFAGRDYAVLSGVVADLPLTIRLFDTLNYANLLLFSDHTKSVPIGSRSLSVAAEVDTVSTVLLVFTARDFDNAGILKRTRTDKYRLFGNAYMTIRAIDFQDNTTGLSLSLRLVNG